MITYGELYHSGAYEDAYLMHYGIKGMKWGVRRKSRMSQPTALSTRVRRGVNKKALGVGAAAAGTAAAVGAAGRALYKKRKADVASGKVAAKKERKQKIKSTYKDLQKNAGVGQRLLYSDGTRRQQAKYMVDKGMSREEAAKKAKRNAWRNTAMIVGGMGAAAAGQAAYNAYKNRSATPRLPGTKMKKVAGNVYKEVAVGRRRR